MNLIIANILHKFFETIQHYYLCKKKFKGPNFPLHHACYWVGFLDVRARRGSARLIPARWAPLEDFAGKIVWSLYTTDCLREYKVDTNASISEVQLQNFCIKCASINTRTDKIKSTELRPELGIREIILPD